MQLKIFFYNMNKLAQVELLTIIAKVTLDILFISIYCIDPRFKITQINTF